MIPSINGPGIPLDGLLSNLGRFVVWDKKTKTPIEPDFEPSIEVTEESEKGVSGPLGFEEEIR